mgnify:CR=1 FL=1|tara:strand:+ start:1139 stop:2278 length:1140 start_codon:yes stop_codon:yes gene_type:complete
MSNSSALELQLNDPFVWVGFASAVLSSFGSTAALMVVRLSTEREKKLPFCQRKYFFIGAWSNLLCEVVLTSIALALAPLTLLAPLCGLTIVFGAWFSWIGIFGVKKEKFSIIEGVFMGLTTAGITIAAIYGPKPKEDFTADDLWKTSQRLLDWPHLIYGTSGWFLALTWCVIHMFDRCFARFRPSPQHPISAPISGMSSAWLASYSLCMFKIVMTTLRTVFSGDLVPLRYGIFWVSTVGLFPCACLQIYSLNITMGAGGTNYVLPIYASMMVTLTATVGIVIFDDFDGTPWIDRLLFWAPGVVLTIAGLVVLGRYQARRATEEATHRRSQQSTGVELPHVSAELPVADDEHAYFCGVRLHRTCNFCASRLCPYFYQTGL